MVSIDRSSNNRGSEVEVILENNCGLMIEVSLRFEFPTTNNQPEYEAVTVVITIVDEVEVEHLKVRTDS